MNKRQKLIKLADSSDELAGTLLRSMNLKTIALVDEDDEKIRNARATVYSERKHKERERQQQNDKRRYAAPQAGTLDHQRFRGIFYPLDFYLVRFFISKLLYRCFVCPHIGSTRVANQFGRKRN